MSRMDRRLDGLGRRVDKLTPMPPHKGRKVVAKDRLRILVFDSGGTEDDWKAWEVERVRLAAAPWPTGPGIKTRTEYVARPTWSPPPAAPSVPATSVWEPTPDDGWRYGRPSPVHLNPLD